MTSPAPVAAPAPDASAHHAAAVLTAFATAAKRLQRRPLPVSAAERDRWQDSPPQPRHLEALLHVVSEPDSSVSALAARLGVSLATASQVVTDLEDKGLVARIEDPTDRRRTLVSVGTGHRELTDALLDTRLRPVQRTLDRLTADEQRAFLTGLTALAEELER